MADSIDPSHTAALDLLTPRERDVLDLFLQGHAMKEVAAQLGIDKSRASSHKTALMKKLGLENNHSLILLGIKCGLLNHPRN